VDWELSSLGDPLLDLGHLLVTWPGPDIAQSAVEPLPGLPPATELVSAYAQRSGRDLRDLPWFRVLAAYRLAIILEGSYARACAGQAPASVGDMLHGAAIRLLARARRVMASC
jgi:aminoglycoside phosphotransferase (APT) family kinase protein